MACLVRLLRVHGVRRASVLIRIVPGRSGESGVHVVTCGCGVPECA